MHLIFDDIFMGWLCMGTAVAWKASVHENGFAYGGIKEGMNAYMRRWGFDKAIMHMDGYWDCESCVLDE